MIKKIVVRTLLFLIVIYAGDYAWVRLRHQPTGSVTVRVEFDSGPLAGVLRVSKALDVTER